MAATGGRLAQLKSMAAPPSTVKRSGLRDITNSVVKQPLQASDTRGTPAKLQKPVPLKLQQNHQGTVSKKQPTLQVKATPMHRDIACLPLQSTAEAVKLEALVESAKTDLATAANKDLPASVYDEVEYMPPKELIQDPNEDVSRMDYNDPLVNLLRKTSAPSSFLMQQKLPTIVDSDLSFEDEPVPALLTDTTAHAMDDTTALSPFCTSAPLMDELLNEFASCQLKNDNLSLDFDDVELALAI
jgi:hypothetical protein